MHRKLGRVRQGQQIVHEGEYSLFVFSSIVRPKNDGLALFNIEQNSRLAVESESLIVFYLFSTGIHDGKIGFKVVQFFWIDGTNEHVGAKVLLPGHFVDETNLLARGGRCTHVAIKDVDLVQSVEIIHSLLVQFVKDFWRSWLIDVVPIHVFGRLRAWIQNDKLVLGRSARELASRDGKGGSIFCLGNDSLLVGLFVFKDFIVGQVPVHGGGVGDANFVNADLLAGSRPLEGLRDIVGMGFAVVVKGRGCALESLLMVLERGVGFQQRLQPLLCLTV